MTIEEASEKYCIPIKILKEYESMELCKTVKRVMGEWHYDDEDIKIKDSDKMVLFLYRVTVGGGYTTNDEYYQVVGGSNQGIFFLDESAEKETYKSNSQNFDALEWGTAKAQLLEVANELPIDQSGLLEYETEQLKAELESGKITQDEYDTTLESYTKYATIID